MGSMKFSTRIYLNSATNIEQILFIRNTGQYILNFIMKISNISPEIDISLTYVNN